MFGYKQDDQSISKYENGIRRNGKYILNRFRGDGNRKGCPVRKPYRTGNESSFQRNAKDATELRGVGQHTQNNTNYQNNYNKSVNDGSSAVSFLLGKAKTMATTLGAAFGAKQVIGLSDTMASSRARLI